jgi:hypothetical protein
MAISDTSALVLLASLIGVELCVAAFFHPTLNSLNQEASMAGRARSARDLGKVMPFWYAAASVSGGIATWASWPGTATWLWGLATLMLVAVIVATVAVLVPLNTLIASHAPSQPADISRWDQLHRLRTGALVVALAIEVIATTLGK